jgi:hypothetical protein
VPVNGWRCVRVLLTVLLVVVPAVVGVLAGSSVESEAAGLPGPHAAHGSDFTLLIQPDGSLWPWGVNCAGRLGEVPIFYTIAASFAIDTNAIEASAGENGTIDSEGTDSADLKDLAVAKGDVVAVSVTASDGTASSEAATDAVTVGNTAPVAGTVTIAPDPAYAGTQDFTAAPSGFSDVDPDTLSYTYSWTKNGTTAGTDSATVNLVVVKGDVVAVSVTASDGTASSEAATDAVTVGNTAPVAGTVTIAPDPAYAGTQDFTAAPSGFSDVDPDTLSYTYSWTKNGTTAGTDSATVNLVVVKGDVVAVSVTASDGTASSEAATAQLAVSAVPTYKITATAGANGKIDPSGDVMVNSGAAKAFTITPVANYHVADVLVDGSSVGAVTSYTFANVKADHSVTASFAVDTFTITPTAGLHGAISPTSPQTVAYGADQACTIAPATGYHVADVLVDGVSVGPVTSYTFTAVSANHTISATFAVNTYAITPSAGANGSISPKTPQTVAYGAEQAFTFAAATGYYIADVLVDGVSVGPVAKYNFTAVAANHTIGVSFAPGVQTRLSNSVGKPIVNYGSSTLLTGVLYDSGDPLHEVGMGDRLVIVQSASSATGPWVDLETLTTSSVAGSVGMCTLTVTPTGPAYYRLRFVAGEGSGYGGSISFVVRVGVRPVLGTPKVPASVRARRSFTVYGTLDPQLPAGEKTVQINVYRYKHHRWVFTRQVSATNADSGGSTRYGVKVKLTTKGKYRFRAHTAPTVTWAGDTSRLSTVLTVK